jgi:hypothetical protein|tara:strand:+ start:207 stop:437 length:231 start_codon:yes stop_codon:yes gene_type:complete
MDDDRVFNATIYKCAELFADHTDEASVVIEALLKAVSLHINIMSKDNEDLAENFQQAHEILKEGEVVCLERRVTLQ